MMLTLRVLPNSGPSEGAQRRAAGRALSHYCHLFVKREDFEWFSQISTLLDLLSTLR